MKTPALIIGILLISLINSESLAQLVAEAGNDTALCADNPNSLTIGGNPTASGGTPPYQYIWSGSYQYAGRTYSASFMLEDTTVANPVFRGGAIPDSVILYILVKDQDEELAIDSIQIRLSKYLMCLGECRYDIAEGDSVQLGPCCITGGIPPIQYQWEPSESLSDTTIQFPWAKPTESSSYTVTIIDSIGCQATTSSLVNVIPLSINDLSDINEIVIFPNPSSRVLKIQFNLESYYNTSFRIFDFSGKKVIDIKVYDPGISINLNGINPGIYIYQWDSRDNQLASGKIIIE